MSLRVKICGLRTEADVEAALAGGADVAGFNFWPGSRRFLAPERAAALVRALPRAVLTVGVFVNATPEEVARAVELSGVQVAQLHGDEEPSRYRHLGIPLIQVVRIRAGQPLSLAPAEDAASLVLLDAYADGYGGSGTAFDWSLAPGAARALKRPILVAGGLTPGNVAQAVQRARPWGVDVASGVESAPGVKCPEKVRAFVAAARAAAREVEAR